MTVAEVYNELVALRVKHSELEEVVRGMQAQLQRVSGDPK